MITHIAGNYLPLVVKETSGAVLLYRTERAGAHFRRSGAAAAGASNLVNNAIKFDTGCIVLQVCTRGSWSSACAIPRRYSGEVETSPVRSVLPCGHWRSAISVGTGLVAGLGEKLINLMDGDIAVESEIRVWAALTSIRIPLFNACLPSRSASDIPVGPPVGWIFAISAGKLPDGDSGVRPISSAMTGQDRRRRGDAQRSSADAGHAAAGSDPLLYRTYWAHRWKPGRVIGCTAPPRREKR